MHTIKLSDSESRFVRLCEKRHRLWAWARWLNLGLALLCVAATVWVVVELGRFDTATASSFEAALVAWLWPICLVLLIMGFGWATFTVQRWNGDLRTLLLLRLLQEHKEQNA